MIRFSKPAFVCVLFAVSVFGSQANAQLKLASFFSDNMVIQREQPVAIWGTAKPRTQVTATLHGATAITAADDKGKWKLNLPKLAVKKEGATLEIANGSKVIEIKNVLVGDVWFAGGQSNMFFELKKSENAEAEIKQSDIPGVRMFLAQNTAASKPRTNIKGAWYVSSPETSRNFSAAAYYFAKRIHEETGVPIGIIKSCWGGKRCECFTSREAMLSNVHGSAMIERLDKVAETFDREKAKKQNEKRLAEWREKTKEIREFNKGKEKADQKRVPRKPGLIKHPYEFERNPTVLYNGMIHPFVGYTMRGAIWYQGEANAKPDLAPIYKEMFSLMIKDWRTRWGSDFPFYFVQLANFKKATVQPGLDSDWAITQNQQRLTLELGGTGMATINDVGAANDIHPRDKKTVGNRLALWALANEYRKNVVVSGPLFKSHSIADGKVSVEFDHVGGGLKSRDGKPLQRFELAGDDKKWHWATAKIEGANVVVSCPEVPKPVAIRYAWAANPEGANLVNEEGLPASLFRTDDWKAGK